MLQNWTITNLITITKDGKVNNFEIKLCSGKRPSPVLNSFYRRRHLKRSISIPHFYFDNVIVLSLTKTSIIPLSKEIGYVWIVHILVGLVKNFQGGLWLQDGCPFQAPCYFNSISLKFQQTLLWNDLIYK